MASMLYDDPLMESPASDEDQAAYAAAVFAAAVRRREREADAVAAGMVPRLRRLPVTRCWA